MDEELDSKLDIIVGKALRGLTMSGASDEFIGSFSASYRAEVAVVLGISQKTFSKEELIADIQALVTTAAVKAADEALQKAGITPRRANSTRVGINVAGKRTTVSLRHESFERVVEAKGSITAAKHFIRTLAVGMPTDVDNRSSWIESRLTDAVIQFGASIPVEPGAKH